MTPTTPPSSTLATCLILLLAGAALPADAGPGTDHRRVGGRQTADDQGSRPGEWLSEFLLWAHPRGQECEAPRGMEVVDRWEGGLRVDFSLACGTARRLAAVLEIREQAGIRQVTGGFEAERGTVDEVLRAWRREAGTRDEPAIPGLSPPPDNLGRTRPRSPLGAVVAPQVLQESRPDYPEEAARARLIGEAHVELLVSISTEGIATDSRPLLGPEPDLGMRQAAREAVRRFRFRPAKLRGSPVRYFLTIDLPFEGLPAESRSWEHRALFHVEAIVARDEALVEDASRRLLEGAGFGEIEAWAARAGARAGDWGYVSAASLPVAIRRVLHDVPVGIYAGPVEAEGMHYLMIKRGEIYYAIRPAIGAEMSYQILHRRGAPGGEKMKRIIESDIGVFLAEHRRLTYINEAARLMGIRQRQVDRDRLQIRTDVLGQEEIDLLADVVEATIRAHEDFWGPIAALRPFQEQIMVYAFARKRDHDRLHGLWKTGRLESGGDGSLAASEASWSTSGEYTPASRLLSIPCEEMGGHLPVPILIHEAFHMLDYERVFAIGVQPSQWFVEGLATYFGFSQVDSQLRIEPGVIRRSGTIISGDVKVQFDPRARLREYQRRIREEGDVSLRALLNAGPGDPLWSGEKSFRAYSASWTLVHFLRHGEKGRHRPAFDEYARREVTGAGGLEAFRSLFGPDLETLEAAWHRHESEM